MSESDSEILGIRGWLIDTPEYGTVRSRPDSALLVEEGVIRRIDEYAAIMRTPGAQRIRWIHSPRCAVFPGLVDLHTHLPQYPVVARGSGELLPWLRQQIFPVEREFNAVRARAEAPAFFAELARHGTTTAMVYSAIFEDSCETAFHAAARSGLRIIMGKMMMDIGSYGQLQPVKITSVSLHESERLCAKWHGAADGLLDYAWSPRFAVSCSEKMLREVSEGARRSGAYIQTHLAENREECAKVRHQFPWARDYADVYEQCGLLGERTVLGHCLHVSPREIEALAAGRAAVAHCPTANLFLGSGILALDELRSAGLRVGLGSDVAAGPEVNLWQVMRSTIESQRARSFFKPDVPVPSPGAALYLATQGGADALGKKEVIGSFEVGKQADCVVVDYNVLLPYRRVANPPLSAEDVVSICVYRGTPAAVLETFVRGRSVFRAPEPELF